MNFVCGWDELWRKQFTKSNAEYRARPDYDALVAEAAQKGYRPITLAEQMDTGSVDAYTWRGGVWVKCSPT